MGGEADPPGMHKSICTICGEQINKCGNFGCVVKPIYLGCTNQFVWCYGSSKSTQKHHKTIPKEQQPNIHCFKHVFSKFPQVLIEKHRRIQSRRFKKLLPRFHAHPTLIFQAVIRFHHASNIIQTYSSFV